jgi:hypothetical protein
VLRFFASPTRTQRLVDSLYGVRRRRRQAAYMSIAGGLVVLRPMLIRVALLGFAVGVLALR